MSKQNTRPVAYFTDKSRTTAKVMLDLQHPGFIGFTGANTDVWMFKALFKTLFYNRVCWRILTRK